MWDENKVSSLQIKCHPNGMKALNLLGCSRSYCSNHYPAQGSTGQFEPPRCTWRLATPVYLLRDISNAAVKVPEGDPDAMPGVSAPSVDLASTGFGDEFRG